MFPGGGAPIEAVMSPWPSAVSLSPCDPGLFPQGYRQKDYFIATQGPLPHTVEDFWRMVWEWKCHTIVMLTEVQEREQVRAHPAAPQFPLHQYWRKEFFCLQIPASQDFFFFFALPKMSTCFTLWCGAALLLLVELSENTNK